MAPMKKSRGSSSGYRYRTTGSRGSFKRTAYKKKSSKITLFQEPKKSAEYKNVDTVLVDAATAVSLNTFNSPAYLLNGIAQGVSPNQRVGRKYTLRSMQYRMQFSAASGASPNANAMRVLVVLDRQANQGATPAAVTDVLQTNTFVSPINLGNAERFLVVSDKVFQASSNGPTTGECFRKMSLEVLAAGTGATSADINSGALLMFVAQTGAASTTFNLYARVRFTDL